ncbi:hypothetical protein CDAR_613311 [Caerostris darwini]|uniref:Uncharacterized protein n=1 Tax=Caerostris darwini TaxID=1538125 RepID=A0AAV4V660_9ARAC|nr:hypothetical protein CDAR_613311 [Caerostris darwini]
MDHSLQIDSNSLKIRSDVIARQIREWGNVYACLTERRELLLSDEIDNLTYPLCRRKQEEIINFLRALVKNREEIESLFRRILELKALLMQHDNILLLKKLLIDETFLLNLMRNVDEAKFRLLQYDNSLKRHEINLRIKRHER